MSAVEMFVGQVDGGTERVAFELTTDADGAMTVRAYACDGEPGGDVEWFVGLPKGSDIALTSTLNSESRIAATMYADSVVGQITLADHTNRSFTAARATHGEGIFRIDVSADGVLSGTSKAGGTLIAKRQLPAAGDPVAYACGGTRLVGSIVAPDGVTRDLHMADLSNCSATELQDAQLPLVFADYPGEGNQPEAYTAIVLWDDEAYQSIVGRAFLPPSLIALPQFVGLIGLVRTYQNTTVTPIPDNNVTGATVRIDVPEVLTFQHIDVTVDIEHTYRADLSVQLFKNGASIVYLEQNGGFGGPAQNISKTYSITPGHFYSAPDFVEGSLMRGSWALKVTDTAAQDTGRIKLFRLRFYR